MRVTIYTDGGADPNPGYGGWAALLRYGKREKVLTGHEANTTNNRMELQAAISALQALNRPCEITFYTDSEYVRRGITEWIERWAAKGWMRGRKPVPNRDLWEALWHEVHRHNIDWQWVRGHAGDPDNERVDALAREARLAITPRVELPDAAYRVYVRASVKGSPGPGAWGAVIESGTETRQFSGGERSTTNNRMELMGAVEGLRLIPEGSSVVVVTMSDYVFQGATRWLPGWRRRGWLKKDGKPVGHADLWRDLDRLQSERTTRWESAKGQEQLPDGLREAALVAAAARDL